MVTPLNTAAWSHVVRNVFRPGFFTVMADKVLKRSEADTRAEAIEWAQSRSTTIEDYCQAADAALWTQVELDVAALECDGRERIAAADVALGGGGACALLQFLVRWRRPTTVVETGVAAGWSSRAILEGLRANGFGRLYSSDFPYFRLPNPSQYVGLVVPDDLRDLWHLDLRGDSRALPDITSQIEQVGLFHYDSDKSARGRRFAVNALRPLFDADTVVIMDDIQDNTFFKEWVAEEGVDFHVFRFGGKYIGAVGLNGPVEWNPKGART